MPRPAPLRPVSPPPAHGSHHGAATQPKPVEQSDIDDALLSELEVSLDEDQPAPAKSASAKPVSLDDEMTKLLGELSNNKR